MHFTKKSLVPALVSIIFLFSIAYAMRYSYVKLSDVLYLDNADTTDNPPAIYRPADLGGMFNERGFMKSNAISFDDKEIINDFNGNLMYRIPIAQGKGWGDLFYDVSLNYNGNVSYQVITADPWAQYWNFGQLHQYNFTAPGWIFSFNGLAVQMLTFESYYFTRPDVNNQATGKNVHLLANGYNLTDRLTTSTPSIEGADRITIMMGDGSTETLKNTNSNGGYEGTYVSQTLNSFLKAEVVSYGEKGAGDLRVMYLMKGDGLTYIYREYNVQYRDNDGGFSTAPWFKPQIFLLKEVKDRFGHRYDLEYYFGGADKIGRPRLISCPGVYFNYISYWDTYYGLKLTTTDGFYKLYTGPFGIYADQNHRPNLQFIRNPSGEAMSFEYNDYIRKGINLYNNNNNNNLTVKLGGTGNQPLSRLSKVTNYNGGVREYTYRSDATELTADYDLNPSFHAGAHVIEDGKYFGQGRDYFFANMLHEVKVKNGSQQIRTETFTYDYDISHRETPTFVNVWAHPIDTLDEYITIRGISSSFSTYNYNTPTSGRSEKTYRNYATRLIPAGERTDFDGTIKLVKDLYYSGSDEDPYKTLIHTYHKDIARTTSQSDFDGTFLDSIYYENYGGKTRQWVNNYVGGGLSNIGVPILIQEKTEFDPLGRKTVTHYTNFEQTDNIVLSEGIFRVGTTQTIDDTIQFYLLQQPDMIRIIKGSTLLQKKTFEYYDSPDVTVDIVEGYSGQVKYDKDIDPQNSAVLRQITYIYSNRDTTGRYVYGTSNFASPIEGNIKQITDANGNKTKYYYDIISRSEDVNFVDCMNNNGNDEIFCPPRFTRHVLFDNGVDTVESTTWNDQRMPSRIDRYVNGSRYLTNYQRYNQMGNPTGMVDNNNYYSYADYDKYGRISSVTLPYDFSRSFPETTYTTISTTVLVELHSKGKSWGKLNGASEYCTPGTYYLKDWQHISEITELGGYGFVTHRRQSGIEDDPNDRNITAIIQYNDTNFKHISSIDSAFLELGPYYLKAQYNGSSTTEYDVVVKPIKQLDTVGGCLNVVMSGTSESFGNMSFSSSTNCGSNPYDINNVHLANRKRLDFTDLLRENISTENGLELRGLNFEINYTGSGNELKEFILDFLVCPNTDLNLWLESASPKLIIYGHKTFTDIIMNVNYHAGTLIYNYDDINNKVKVLSKIDNSGSSNRHKTTEHYFDKFGKLTQSRLYTGTTTYNSTNMYYNYLDGKGKITDPAANDTKFSYDKYGNPSGTKNADNSENLTADTYQNSLTTFFYTISGGFVNKKTYTDETGRLFNKYFDAVGNLLREVKFAAGDGSGNTQENDNPFDPDTTYEGQDAPSEMVELGTDYKYDDLYRVIEVKTPDGKHIYYQYDALGRQKQRQTPDAGVTKYLYDKNNNLTYSQDANQLARGSTVYTFRNYDGLNRLLTLGENQPGGGGTEFANIEEGTEYDAGGSADNLFVINAYDSLVYSPVTSLFTNVPSDYYSAINNTKGNLVATAYRTRLADAWGFKFYRYDARGRVIRFWHYISGLGWKSENYYYNSQNQLKSNRYQPGASDEKMFTYGFDNAARLSYVNLYVGGNPSDPETETDAPSAYLNLTNYSYNANSQVYEHKLNNNQYTITYAYNNRNWVSMTTLSPVQLFRYIMLYNANGNIRKQISKGSYSSNFADNSDLWYTHIYDNSNRLVKSDRDSGTSGASHDIINNYDKDGNFKSLSRYGSSDNQLDNFRYTYNTGTNKIQKITGSSSPFYEYDNNGSVTKDELNSNIEMKYDWRNLLIENKNTLSQFTFKTMYRYDEAGNRIRKVQYMYVLGEPPIGGGTDSIIVDEGDGNGYWALQQNIFYVRDVSGKEIAIYSGSALQQWNIWGLDNVGKINADTTKNYYLKDHLGSTRAVINSTNTVVSAQDYDCWGYILENRSYQSENTKYKFTGKERDKDLENNYDYFGARYYDSRIANWTSIDPLFEKHIQWTPYNYVLRNPIYYFDPNGLQESAILRFAVEVAEQSTKTIAPLLGIPLGAIGMIANFILSPREFGYAELKDNKIFTVGEEGYLVSPYPTEEITVTTLRSEGINIPDEDKITTELLNPPGKRGDAPTSIETGEPIEIHHIGQKKGGPYEERFRHEHRTEGSYKNFHDPKKQSEREKNWSYMVKKYWQREWDSGRFDR